MPPRADESEFAIARALITGSWASAFAQCQQRHEELLCIDQAAALVQLGGQRRRLAGQVAARLLKSRQQRWGYAARLHLVCLPAAQLQQLQGQQPAIHELTEDGRILDQFEAKNVGHWSRPHGFQRLHLLCVTVPVWELGLIIPACLPLQLASLSRSDASYNEDAAVGGGGGPALARCGAERFQLTFKPELSEVGPPHQEQDRPQPLQLLSSPSGSLGLTALLLMQSASRPLCRGRSGSRCRPSSGAPSCSGLSGMTRQGAAGDSRFSSRPAASQSARQTPSCSWMARAAWSSWRVSLSPRVDWRVPAWLTRTERCPAGGGGPTAKLKTETWEAVPTSGGGSLFKIKGTLPGNLAVRGRGTLRRWAGLDMTAPMVSTAASGGAAVGRGAFAPGILPVNPQLLLLLLLHHLRAAQGHGL